MSAWMFVTRWGSSMLLLPAAASICLGLWASGDRRTAGRWAVCFGVAVLAVLATKLAFIGWGVGISRLDFTGISGHSTLAASVLPTLAWWLTRERAVDVQVRAIAAAAALALLVGISRLLLSTHSTSEVVFGLALGAVAAWIAIPQGRVAARGTILPWAVLTLLLIAGLVPGVGESDGAHGLVVRIALMLSGRGEPFTRDMLQM